MPLRVPAPPLGLGVDTSLDSIGFYKLRAGEDKEDHLYNAETIVALQQATQNGDYSRFKEYTAMVDNQQKPHTLRGLLELLVPRVRLRLRDAQQWFERM